MRGHLVSQPGRQGEMAAKAGIVLALRNQYPRHILLHTLAHLLMRQMSLDCGYSSASLRERIYSDEKMAGLLIYTSTPDSDGSLGGLVRQTKPSEKFDAVLRSAQSWLGSAQAILSVASMIHDVRTGSTVPPATPAQWFQKHRASSVIVSSIEEWSSISQM